jgi:predicted Zn-dependent protease
MKRGLNRTILIFWLSGILLIACSRVPISNRRQLNMLPEGTLMSLSMTQYREFMTSNRPLPDTDPRVSMVKGVGRKISNGATTFLKRKRQTKRIKNFKWEFNVVDNPTVNAWCMPGGKVMFYTGILPVTQDETGVAVVMGHEVAHAIARHGNERLSQQLSLAGLGVGLAVLLNEKPRELRDLFLSAYGIGGTLGILAYSRNHELEADKMGLVFMAMAGYNPEAAVGFWERMAQQSAGMAKPPEFLSTHPSDQRRIRDIQNFLPEARKYYRPS